MGLLVFYFELLVTPFLGFKGRVHPSLVCFSSVHNDNHKPIKNFWSESYSPRYLQNIYICSFVDSTPCGLTGNVYFQHYWTSHTKCKVPFTALMHSDLFVHDIFARNHPSIQTICTTVTRKFH